MKPADPQKAFGAVIGKALKPSNKVGLLFPYWLPYSEHLTLMIIQGVSLDGDGSAQPETYPKLSLRPVKRTKTVEVALCQHQETEAVCLAIVQPGPETLFRDLL
jgi:hypothetical protein